MPTPAGQLPANVLDALTRGRSIEAIKLLRDATGMSLTEAKGVIDGHLRSNPLAKVSTALVGGLPFSVTEALQQGNKIEAIRLMRKHTGLGLKEAKDAVEAVQHGTAPVAGKLSPGEVSKSSHVSLWIVVIAIVGIAVYYFLRGAS